MATSPATTLPALRVAVGAGAWATPNLAARLFGLDPKNNPQASYLGRLFGVRDVALAITATQSTGSSRRLAWQVGIACDLFDAAAAVLGARNGSLSRTTAVLGGGVALAAAGLGVAPLAAED
jgi:hypothetical protein